MDNIFLKRHKEIFFIALLFLAAFFVRWHKMPEYLFFGFEQGRDAFVTAGIYTLEDFTLVGPKTDVGGIFHGPWYYYLMTVPYGLSGGNPLAASFFLIILSSIIPIVVYYLFKDIFKSWKWGLLGGVLVVFSFEFIVYSRWLSNVTPAALFVALAFFALWRYLTSKKEKYFVLSVISSSLASQFEIILLVEFVFVFLALFLLRFFRVSWRACILGILGGLGVFAPMIIFDFRNQHIILNSILSFAAASLGGSGGGNLFHSLELFQLKFVTMIRKTLVVHKEAVVQLFALVVVLVGLVNQKEKAKALVFLLVWSFMSVSIFLIGAGLEQAYVGSGLGFIGLFLVAVKSLWQKEKTRVLVVVLFLIVFTGWVRGFDYLNKNKEIFFVTVQDDLNLKDQKKLLDFVHQDASGKPYKLVAFTIPYLHPEGWEYLHKFYYPQDKKDGAKIAYVIIESQVAHVWEDRWIKDLGGSNLLSEQTFGKIRLQKRAVF